MLTGRALQRRAYVAAAIPPMIRLKSLENGSSVAALAVRLGEPDRVVMDACVALEREGWVAFTNGRVTLTAKATVAMDEWETEMQGALR